MSRFFSPNYLKRRQARRRGPIESDLYCALCGYNLRGLDYSRVCPECGEAIAEQRGLHDLLLSGPENDRGRWRLGLGLAALCVWTALVTRVLFFVLTAPGVDPLVVEVYLGIGAINSLVWVFAVWLVTPESLLTRWPWMRRPRLAARLLALMWIVGYACLHVRYHSKLGPGVEPWVELGDYLGRFLGGVGVMFVGFILHFVAEEAELEKAARRLNAAVWILWFPTLLAQAFPPQIAWFTLVILGMVLFFWGWLMALLGLGLSGLSKHVRWAGIHAIEKSGRPGRVAQTRREIDDEVEATIRPLPELRQDGPPDSPASPG